MIENEKLSANLPAEPGPKAVVVGARTGMSYQRHGNHWLPPGLSFSGLFGGADGGYTWLGILTREQSVTLVWDPKG